MATAAAVPGSSAATFFSVVDSEFRIFGVAEGAKFDGDPEYWTVHDGKLYLNLNGDVLMLWRKNIKGNLDIAKHNWKKIAGKPPGELTPYKIPQKIK